MPSTLVIQSQRKPLPSDWLSLCLDSVKSWASLNRYDYRFVDDALFDCLDPALMRKLAAQKVIASDLARLKWLQQGLREGYDRVFWCDSDFLIFSPGSFIPPAAEFAVGREVWVQRDWQGSLRVYKKVHNAFLMFQQGNSFLDFYCDTAENLLRLNQAGMPPQFIGPKLLSALHNIAKFPVMESAGMLSPPVMRDLLSGGGEALQLFRDRSPVALAGANLSYSMSAAGEFDESEMNSLIQTLLA